MLVEKFHGLEIPTEINHLENLNLWFLGKCVLARCRGAGAFCTRTVNCLNHEQPGKSHVLQTAPLWSAEVKTATDNIIDHVYI